MLLHYIMSTVYHIVKILARICKTKMKQDLKYVTYQSVSIFTWTMQNIRMLQNTKIQSSLQHIYVLEALFPTTPYSRVHNSKQ